VTRSTDNLLDAAVGAWTGASGEGDWSTDVEEVVASLQSQRRDYALAPRLAILLATPDWCNPDRPLSRLIRANLRHVLGVDVPLIGGSMPRIFVARPSVNGGGPGIVRIEAGFAVLLLCSNDLWASVELLERPYDSDEADRDRLLADLASRLLQARNSHMGLGSSASD
jgi:hypothetical protein